MSKNFHKNVAKQTTTFRTTNAANPIIPNLQLFFSHPFTNFFYKIRFGHFSFFQKCPFSFFDGFFVFKHLTN